MCKDRVSNHNIIGNSGYWSMVKINNINDKYYTSDFYRIVWYNSLKKIDFNEDENNCLRFQYTTIVMVCLHVILLIKLKYNK